jgi:hypothetical protein
MFTSKFSGSMNKLTDFYKAWCECYAIRGHLSIAVFYFLRSVTTMWQTLKHSGWRLHQSYFFICGAHMVRGNGCSTNMQLRSRSFFCRMENNYTTTRWKFSLDFGLMAITNKPLGPGMWNVVWKYSYIKNMHTHYVWNIGCAPTSMNTDGAKLWGYIYQISHTKNLNSRNKFLT